jgi:hypothetical protein
MKADVICENENCPGRNMVVHTVTFPMAEEDAFYEAFGHGGEDPEDFCQECGRIGVLQDPDITMEERDEFVQRAKDSYESDDIEIDEEPSTSLADDRSGIWVRAWVWVPISEKEGGDEGGEEEAESP